MSAEYHALITAGHSHAKAQEIMLDVARGDVKAKKWVAEIMSHNGADAQSIVRAQLTNQAKVNDND